MLVTPQVDLQAVMITNSSLFNAKLVELEKGDFKLNINQFIKDFGNLYVSSPPKNIVANISSDVAGERLNEIISELGLGVY